MKNSQKTLLTFIAGAAVGALAAILMNKSNREKLAQDLRGKAESMRNRIKDELDNLSSKQSPTQE